MAKIIPFLPNCEFYFDRGMAAFEKYQYPQAIHYLRRGQSLAKSQNDYIFTTCQLAVCLEAIGNYQTAKQELEAIPVKSYAKHPEVQYFLATVYIFLDRYEDSYHYAQEYLLSGQHDFAVEALDLISELENRRPSRR
ncbi:hypothetical protein IV38_GL001494 [Lactobacillus selangorensis]|uniref:Tetratricopeptide repeat protein n=1 Tax=Lactobacillus selangorensis TaxID=81857 RepID=A0A0R2FUR2_9LACO|nr:tetratricopeptide repeat protein [Lactobacillus selangorensis]KRN28492.1 hypothetical protein IV38_GL001494 [Lactobacillus selangorensis]KRN31992.1 hypothetical protein IV40_GL001280 [Lactobacillus selangorensis]